MYRDERLRAAYSGGPAPYSGSANEDRSRSQEEEAMTVDAASIIRSQIESVLERALSDHELADVHSADDLTPAQLNLVTVLKRRNIVTAVRYLRAVLPSVATKELQRFIDSIEDYIATKIPLADRRLNNESLFERTLGRPLIDAERRPIPTLDELSPEQRAAAASMYARNIDTAILYVAAIASKVTAKLSEQWIIATFESSPRNRSSE